MVEYVEEENLGGEASLGDLAQVANLSPSHFLVGFRRSTGTTPHQYVIGRRVERAAGLLERGEATAAEAAVEVGFYARATSRATCGACAASRRGCCSGKVSVEDRENVQKGRDFLQDLPGRRPYDGA